MREGGERGERGGTSLLDELRRLSVDELHNVWIGFLQFLVARQTQSLKEEKVNQREE